MGSGKENLVSADFTDKQKSDALEAVKNLKGQFNFLLSLSADDRQSLAKVSDEAMDACRSFLLVLEKFPTYFPKPVIDLAETRKDLSLADSLQPIYESLAGLTEALESTVMAARSDTYRNILKGYALAQMLAKDLPGMETALEPLRKIFDRRGKKTQKEGIV